LYLSDAAEKFCAVNNECSPADENYVVASWVSSVRTSDAGRCRLFQLIFFSAAGLLRWWGIRPAVGALFTVSVLSVDVMVMQRVGSRKYCSCAFYRWADVICDGQILNRMWRVGLWQNFLRAEDRR